MLPLPSTFLPDALLLWDGQPPSELVTSTVVALHIVPLRHFAFAPSVKAVSTHVTECAADLISDMIVPARLRPASFAQCINLLGV